jgi:beta-aspartyl-peptidase (threonine type)
VEGVKIAARVGFDILKRGGTAVDAIEAAVRSLEDDPAFDAGLY